MAIRAATEIARAQAHGNANGSDDGSDGSSPRPFDLDFDLGDEDDITGLPKQHDSAAGPVRRSRRPPSTAERKATHNAVERARRESLNGRFMELATALPTMAHVKRPSKAIIVNKSLEYIYDTRARQDLLAKENEQLRKEINELRSRLSMPSLSPPAPIASATSAATSAAVLDSSSYAAYAAAAHSHAQAQAGSRPIAMPTRHESFSTNSTGASPRSIGSAPELSPPTSYYAAVPSATAASAAAAAVAGSSIPQSFYNYVPVTSALPPPAMAQAPSPTSSATPPPTSHSPASAGQPAATSQDLFSLWSNTHQHHTDSSNNNGAAGLDLFGAATQQGIDFSLPLGGAHAVHAHQQQQAQLQDAWRMPFGQIPGVPVGGMGFNGMF